jgi:hypothetical protein
MQPHSEPESQWTNKGFNQRFEELIKLDITYVEAYILAEEEHVKLFGRIRYKSYDSFRDCRRKLLFPNS